MTTIIAQNWKPLPANRVFLIIDDIDVNLHAFQMAGGKLYVAQDYQHSVVMEVDAARDSIVITRHFSTEITENLIEFSAILKEKIDAAATAPITFTPADTQPFNWSAFADVTERK